MSKVTSPLKRICVFCGASSGDLPEFATLAVETGRTLAQAGIELVYGGGRVGLMGALADATLAAGGRVIGVIPKILCGVEVDHQGLTQLHVVESMHARKALMEQLSDAFIALPGGIGTLEEFFEIWTWAQLGMHAKPCALLNVAGYYDSLITFLDQSLVGRGFLQQKSRDHIIFSHSPEQALKELINFVPRDTRRYLPRSDS